MDIIIDLSSEIRRKIDGLNTKKKISELYFFDDLQTFNERMSSYKKYVSKNIMINGLTKIPGVSIEIAKKIGKTMPTYRIFYNKLAKLKSQRERVKFITWYLRELKTNKDLSELLVDFFFRSSN